MNMQANFWLKEETITALMELADQRGESRVKMLDIAMHIMQTLHSRRQAAPARQEGGQYDTTDH